jgi:hypothetical protein
LEVDGPDQDMAPILASRAKLEQEKAKGEADPKAKLPAYFVMMTDPEHRYEGYVERIAGKPETIDGKHVVKVTVAFDEKVKQDFLKRNNVSTLRPGAEVRARVQCGDAKLAYVLFRDVIHVWYETVLFRWPFLK